MNHKLNMSYFVARLRDVTVAVGCALVIANAAQAVITNVVETGGDNEATDTITAKWTGQTFAVSVDNEPIPGALIGDNYTVTPFQDLAPAFVDRNHRYTNTDGGTGVEVFPIPNYLLGGDYIMSGNDNRDNVPYQLDVTLGGPARGYMLVDNRLQDGSGDDPPTIGPNMQWLLDDGWVATSGGLNRTSDATRPDELGIDEGADGSINQWYSIYTKAFTAPGTVTLLQADNGGRNMYGAVFQLIDDSIVPGDVNGDGVANMDDFPPIRDHFFQSVTGRAEGDLTLDGFVNFADFRQWKDNAVGVGVSSVPEPAMGSLLSIGMLALGMVRRRK